MSPLVVLSASAGALPAGYDVRLGPIDFVTPADTISETIGDGLDSVGAAVIAGDRRPRPLKLKLPVRGDRRSDVDVPEAGRALRRRVRALLDNSDWRLCGLYFVWDADPDLDGWLMIGGADLSEADPGVAFGEFDLDLSDVYMRGRPGTHRPGRRATIGDRRGGLVPRDTRRLLYSTDFAAQALPTEPLYLPGDLADLVASGNQPVSTGTPSLARNGRVLARSVAATDGQVLTYRPDAAVLTDRYAYLNLDDAGAVRVWDLSAAGTYPPAPADYTGTRDERPDLYYGWQRVLGDLLTPTVPLAIDNGLCRLIWLGGAANAGLAIEYWDATAGVDHYVRAGRVLHALNVREVRTIEVTPERAVVEWRAGRYGMRAILQRGWWGPRIESYDDGGSTARLEYAPDAGAATTAPSSVPTWVRSITSAGSPTMLWAQGSNDETVDTIPTVVTGTAATFRRTRALVAQLGPPPGLSAAALASLSLVDARPVPVLVGRR